MTSRFFFLGFTSLSVFLGTYLNPVAVHSQTIVQNLTRTGAPTQAAYTTATGGGDYLFRGDTFTGGADVPYSTAGQGLFINQGSSATIESGTYRGGNGTYYGGFILPGVAGLVIQTDLPVTINGGTFISGYEANVDPSLADSIQSSYIDHPLPITPAQVSVYGGTFLNYAGQPGNISADDSIYTFYGHDLTFLVGDGSALTNGGHGTISGVLANNTGSITFNYFAFREGAIRLVNTPAVPEASTTVSFGLLLALGLGGLVIAKRRRTAVKASSAL